MKDAGKIAFTPKGNYDNKINYEYLDVVQYAGNCYAAKKATVGNYPPTTDSCVDDNWVILLDGNTVISEIPVSTETTAGIVKAGEDIGVDENGEMSLKTDFTEQTELSELTGTENRKTLFGKIAKAISNLISHISLQATSSDLGHVKITNSSAVTDSDGLALAATEKNASIKGTLANQIDTLNNNLDQKVCITNYVDGQTIKFGIFDGASSYDFAIRSAGIAVYRNGVQIGNIKIDV